MNSLYSRLALVFLGILLVLGVLTLFLTQRSAEKYFLEFTQQLNAPIAMYMAENGGLSISLREQEQGLSELASHVMIINPSVEVYLLDKTGRIIGHSQAPEKLQRREVALAPIKQFLSNAPVFPILGDNPIDSSKPHIFSAHPLYDNNQQVAGYVYAVLAGQQHQSLLDKLMGSHTFQNALITFVFILFLALLTGGIIFFMLTRRLRSLTESVRRWQQHGDLEQWQSELGQEQKNDEIGDLASAYQNMAGELLKQYKLLEKTDCDRRDLFADISHDLRTPLTSLQGFLETIQRKKGELSQHQLDKYIGIAHKQSLRLKKLINQLFELSRLNSNEFRIQPEAFCLLELVHDLIQDIQVQADAKSISIEIIPTQISDNSLQVYADLELIQRVFQNLLANALRYTPRHGHIRVKVCRSSDQIQVVVSDNGIGMSEEKISQVFERHYTTDDKKRISSGQAGLGLSIVQNILRLHNCEISLKSNLNQGSSFHFSLPPYIMDSEFDAIATA